MRGAEALPSIERLIRNPIINSNAGSRMEDLEALARNAESSVILQKGRDFLLNDRTIGGGIRLIGQLTKAKRHDEAVELAHILYSKRQRSRDLNVLLTAALASSTADSLRAALALTTQHESHIANDYDVQLIATWLRALFEVDSQNEFWRVYEKICREDDRSTNTFVIVQYLRMLIRAGKYEFVVNYCTRLPGGIVADEIIRKHLARAYVELGNLDFAQTALNDTRDDYLRRSIVARISELKGKAGVMEAGNDVVSETPARSQKTTAKGKPTVFVVFGHDVTSRSDLENVLHRIGAEPWTLDRLPKEGSLTVIELLEKYVTTADAVVTLLTPDDEGRKRGTEDVLRPRGRENVLIEAGFAMISRRSRSLLIALGGVNIPSDFEGIHRIQSQHWNTEVSLRLAQGLRDMGFAVDPNRAV